MHRDNEKIDAGLKENYRIEEAIEALQKESTDDYSCGATKGR